MTSRRTISTAIARPARSATVLGTPSAVFGAGLSLLAAPTAFAQDTAATNNYGADVVNIATLEYTVGTVTARIPTNEAVFTIRPPKTPAVIEFFRYAPTAGHAVMTAVNGSDYSPSGALAGPFSPTGTPETAGGVVIDTSGPIPLIPATTYLAGELMFIGVTDLGANQDSTEIDVIVITIVADNGDEVTLRLYETGPDTGQFFAYLPSTQGQTPTNDPVITAGGNTSLTATYQDEEDSTDVVVDTAVLNPLNRVFSSVDGALVSGATVTLINVDTGERAAVLGVDGFSSYPPEVISGRDTADESGLVYESDTGEFRYPLVEPGTYIVEVEAPEGYVFTIGDSPSDLAAEMSSQYGFVITPGSHGRQFTVTEAGPLRFDIPLDPLADIVVSKAADRSSADIGDYVNYTVTIENIGAGPGIGSLRDGLPLGFRYVPGTARIDAEKADDPGVSDDATLLTFDMGAIAPGETITLDYALQVGPGAPLGSAINEAVVVASDGTQLSNVGRAGLTLREDLLRSTSTIIGRITEQSCDGEADWVRPIDQGIGVDGVRLYMETGAYVVSDEHGLYHFEGVTEGTHVVQVDRETLPDGFELMACEENTRYAGSMESQFVDVQGGGIWRANFYLKRKEGSEILSGEEILRAEDLLADHTTLTEEEMDARRDAVQGVRRDRQDEAAKASRDMPLTQEKLASEAFDVEWLNAQGQGTDWAYPAIDETPAFRVARVGLRHPADQSLSLTINGREVAGYLRDGSITSTDGLTKLSRFKGLNLEDGRNVVVATLRDATGAVVNTMSRDIHYVKTIARITPMPDRSTLVADGRTAPMIHIRMEDEGGRPVHAGRITTIEVEPPHRLKNTSGDDRIREQSEDLLAPLSARQDFQVGTDGILRVPLEPTLRTGKVTLWATTDAGRRVPIYMYLAPEKRDWILVGLAEGSAALDKVRGNAIGLTRTGPNPETTPDEDLVTDGRVAFFAKGMIKGNWLMTLAVDTDKRRGNRDGDFLTEIDPNAYYSLYGDQTYQEYEGVSRYPVYVKLEKQQAYALFGDFSTNITEGRLTSYNRRLSGLKAEYLGDKFQVLGFAAETNQGFAKDEIAADGTSGTYRLSNSRILAQSEEIVVETRDRVRPDVVLERKVMVRYLDYTLDYLTGELLFRLPVDATDNNFNPKVIVADYETSEDVERNLTYGGRVQAQLAGGRVQIGSSFVHEDGSARAAGAEADQIGVDALIDISDTTQARLEYAITDTKGGETADAMLAEIVHTSDRIAAEAYFREEEGGFGLGQTGSNNASARRYGVRANVNVREQDSGDAGERSFQRVEGQAYREENLDTGESRDSAEIRLTHEGPRLSAGVGLRTTRDNLVGREDRESLLATVDAAYEIPKHDIVISARHEQPIGGKDEVSAYPMRTRLGIDKTIGDRARVSVRTELLDGENQRSTNTIAGIDFSPWAGTTLIANGDYVTNDSGRRIGATVGLDQQIKISERWTVSAGLRDRTVLDAEEEYVEVLPDDAISPFERNEDFTSAYIGAGYADETTSASIRGETRQSGAGDTYIGALSAARSVSEKLSIAGSGRIAFNESPLGENTSFGDLRIGTSWRPRDEDVVIFDRFDVSHRNDPGRTETKIVNNLAVNGWLSDRWQATAHWGVKNVRTEIGDLELSNTTHLLGGETRFDVTRKIDLGLRGQMITQTDTDGMSYSWGPSIGVSPVKNVWASLGYNVEGFSDDDFEASEYSRKGPYVTLRVKFDQHTARGLLRRISPGADTAYQTYQQQPIGGE